MTKILLFIVNLLISIGLFYWCFFFASHTAWLSEWWFYPTLALSITLTALFGLISILIINDLLIPTRSV